MTVIALSIAGSDPSGGAGIQADLKTFSALGVYGAAAITALTAQNTRGVQGVEAVAPAFIAAQVRSVLDDLDVRAIKIGMVGSGDAARTIADVLREFPHIPVVLDPVLVATSGDSLSAADTVTGIREALFPLATLITPNIHEAAQLTGGDSTTDPDTLATQARALERFQEKWIPVFRPKTRKTNRLGPGIDSIKTEKAPGEMGARAVLITGGDGEGKQAIDVYWDGQTLEHFEATRIATRNTHGSGCTLSSAIAAYLAKGFELCDAVRAAKVYVSAAIEAADALSVGQGRGPLHHFHGVWGEN